MTTKGTMRLLRNLTTRFQNVLTGMILGQDSSLKINIAASPQGLYSMYDYCEQAESTELFENDEIDIWETLYRMIFA